MSQWTFLGWCVALGVGVPVGIFGLFVVVVWLAAVVEIARSRRGAPTAPVEVMREIVAVCPPRGVVLDPFAGSASTGVAALERGRRFVGVEMSPAIFEEAADRLSDVEAGR